MGGAVVDGEGGVVADRSPPAEPFWQSAGYVVNDQIAQYSRNFEQRSDPSG